MKKTYEITVTQLSAMHINGGTAPDGKRITVKYNGRAYIPATLFKGVFKGSFAALSAALKIDSKVSADFFGEEGFKKSRVILDNLLTSQSSSFETRTNVSISRYTRKALDQMLVTSEVQPPFDKNRKEIPIKLAKKYEKIADYSLRNNQIRQIRNQDIPVLAIKG